MSIQALTDTPSSNYPSLVYRIIGGVRSEQLHSWLMRKFGPFIRLYLISVAIISRSTSWYNLYLCSVIVFTNFRRVTRRGPWIRHNVHDCMPWRYSTTPVYDISAICIFVLFIIYMGKMVVKIKKIYYCVYKLIIKCVNNMYVCVRCQYKCISMYLRV